MLIFTYRKCVLWKEIFPKIMEDKIESIITFVRERFPDSQQNSSSEDLKFISVRLSIFWSSSSVGFAKIWLTKGNHTKSFDGQIGLNHEAMLPLMKLDTFNRNMVSMYKWKKLTINILSIVRIIRAVTNW